MVQMLVRLSASRERVGDILDALRSVMRHAQQARGCDFTGVYLSATDRQWILYVEEWDDGDELRRQFGTTRFHRLLELLELAADRPDVEFRVITAAHGLEYITSQLPYEESHAG